MTDDLASVGECLAGKVGAWFAGEGTAEVADPTALRQMNMALALAASRWNELAGAEDAVDRMRAWLDEVERRAAARDAGAREEAFRRARAWLETCVRDAGRAGPRSEPGDARRRPLRGGP